MQWWRDARFGMFVHWGLYAIPAGAWQGGTDHGEWIRDTARIPVDVYDRFQPQWNPTAFDADAWATTAAAAGMKYLVLTSKHHDGFCLFDSAATEQDVMNTPHGRDICAELAAACARHGVTFCTYHSIMDWHHPDYLPRRPWEVADRPAAGADFDRFERYLHTQVTEVVTKYRPAVMWFDGEWESTWNHERGLRLFDLCRRLAPEMIVNNRVDVHRAGMQGFAASSEAVGDFQTPEQEIPATGVPGVDWESCMTMNRHWGWNAADTQWKSTTDLLRNLIDIASKGGNYLLNVGPRADGSFPPQAVERLAAIGTWMRAHGEAIHGTTASVFDALAFGRCTVKDHGAVHTLYLHVFDWPADRELVLPGLANEVVGVHPLTQPDRILPHTHEDSGVRVRVPVDVPTDAHATVIAVDVRGAPIVHGAPTITAESDRFVTSLRVTVASRGPGLDVHWTIDGSAPTVDAPSTTMPTTLLATTTVKAAAFHRGRQVSDVVSRTFTRVEPTPPTAAVAPHEGLRFTQHTVDWTSIPADTSGLVAELWGTTSTVTAGKAPGEHRALRFTGFLVVPADDFYRFALRSDDGSLLRLDGELVVDNNGLHGAVEKHGARPLGKGLHPIEVVWWNRTGGAELKLSWARPGTPFAEIPAEALRH
jgi:alpha-L-fucosidase